jgi:superfamily II DNA helicase RecQ
METFKALKIKRLKLAKNKPAYMVCEDYTLHAMAENRPLTK